MEEKTKIVLALAQVDNLVNLLNDNESKVFFYGHLISIQCELQRQLTHYMSFSYETDYTQAP